MFVVQAFCLNAALAFLTRLPPHFRRFVPTNVDVFRRKQLHHFQQNLLQKTKSRILACTIDILEHPPIVRNLQRITSATQPRISGNGRTAVSRKLNLWNDGDVAISSVGHDVLDLRLGVKTTMPRSVGLRSPGAGRC